MSLERKRGLAALANRSSCKPVSRSAAFCMTSLLSFAGSVLSLALYGSALYGVVVKGRSKTYNGGNALAGCSPVPYVALLVSCLLWTQYSILIGDPTLTTINTIGVFFSFASAAAFYKYTDSRDRTETTMLKGLGCLYPVLIYTRMRGGAEGISELGFACAASSLFMIVSPLGVLPQVLKTRTTALLSFPLALCSFMSCAVWTCYGAQFGDPYIVTPNAIGSLASFAQLALFWKFGLSEISNVKAKYAAIPLSDTEKEEEYNV